MAAATNQCAAGYYCLEGAIKDKDGKDDQPDIVKETQPGEYSLKGSFFPIKCQEGTYTGDRIRGECDKCEAGFFCDGTGNTRDSRPKCPKGHYCLSF